MGNEVLEYESATCEIHFVAGHVACKYCPLLETYSRNQCKRTGEYVIDINFIGYDCPLQFKENANGI